MRKQPLTGKPCDDIHPFPAPDEASWADSMEFGAGSRRPTTNSFATQDVDTSPTWRAVGAWIWNTDCRDDHFNEIAANTILTTHLLAASMLLRKSAHAIEELAFGQVGATAAIEALTSGGGLAPAHEQIERLSVGQRKELVGECLALLLKGYTNLQLDLEAFYLRG